MGRQRCFYDFIRSRGHEQDLRVDVWKGHGDKRLDGLHHCFVGLVMDVTLTGVLRHVRVHASDDPARKVAQTLLIV